MLYGNSSTYNQIRLFRKFQDFPVGIQEVKQFLNL
ncbi:hypothetical protein BD749_1656 [Pontibacter ramchanderi]|uniref:Uncharacterized protein n=1 Tax=Pontibacter ramchanderi TaxID=1179743 RepID=A0A2N3UAY0_9BACT|nr:hypothetical protein BD749_1656 [Pontibacter ramchanderi]